MGNVGGPLHNPEAGRDDLGQVVARTSACSYRSRMRTSRKMTNHHGWQNDPVNGRVKEDAPVAAEAGDRVVDRTFPPSPLVRRREWRNRRGWVPIGVGVVHSRTTGATPHFRGRTALVQVELTEETIVLSGRLPSHYLKQLLQEAILLISDAVLIDNRITVMRPDHD